VSTLSQEVKESQRLQRIRMLRDLGYTIKRIAKLFGMSPNAISRRIKKMENRRIA
jgi:DNA-binding Lrp family transcriptional regulator